MEDAKWGINLLPYMSYGDALGFLRENSNIQEGLRSFSYLYDQDLELKMRKGQWSYITQLTLINCKCLIDNKEKRRVSIDYIRMKEEINLWRYYKCGTPLNYMYRLNWGKDYYTGSFYWEDERGEAFSRIMPIALVNKNFVAAQEEAYKNIIYTNRHPKVILTGLLLLRVIYLLMNNSIIKREKLINELKDYLIGLQLSELEQGIGRQLRVNYEVRFEQEKINYLLDLDRIKLINFYDYHIPCSKNIFLLALINFLKLYKGEDIIEPWQQDKKEMYAITYALLALAGQTDSVEIDGVKDIIFIKNMNEYLFKLREYTIGRKFFKTKDEKIDLFALKEGANVKHPILNNIKIKNKIKLKNHIKLIIDSKIGEYRFLKEKNS